MLIAIEYIIVKYTLRVLYALLTRLYMRTCSTVLCHGRGTTTHTYTHSCGSLKSFHGRKSWFKLGITTKEERHRKKTRDEKKKERELLWEERLKTKDSRRGLKEYGERLKKFGPTCVRSYVGGVVRDVVVVIVSKSCGRFSVIVEAANGRRETQLSISLFSSSCFFKLLPLRVILASFHLIYILYLYSFGNIAALRASFGAASASATTTSTTSLFLLPLNQVPSGSLARKWEDDPTRFLAVTDYYTVYKYTPSITLRRSGNIQLSGARIQVTRISFTQCDA